MRKNIVACLAMTVLISTNLSAQVKGSRVTTEPGITRQLVIDERTVQAVHATYHPGAVEPPGPHSFDVVIVPLSPGTMDIKIAGKSVAWKVGEAFFIPRGAEHTIANHGRTPVDFVSIRIP